MCPWEDGSTANGMGLADSECPATRAHAGPHVSTNSSCALGDVLRRGVDTGETLDWQTAHFVPHVPPAGSFDMPAN
jgi:hypothetical protein